VSASGSGRLLQHFGTGVLDQILLSGVNFVVGFLMIRYASDADYGRFVLAQSALVLLVSAQGAWLSGPMKIVAPRKSPETRRTMVGAIKISQGRFLRRASIVGLLVPVVGYLLGAWATTITLTIAATILASWTALHREYLRNVLLIYSRPQTMLRADLFYMAVLLAGIIPATLTRMPGTGVWAVVTLALAGWAGALAADRALGHDPGWTTGESSPFWREIRPLGLWSAVGAVIYWLFAQSYNYVLATRLDLTAVTNVNAARLVLMPVFVFTLGVNNLLLPIASSWLAEFGLRRLLRRLALLAIAITALDFCYFLPVWFVRGRLIHDLMHKTIGDQDRLLLLWATVAVIFLLREVLQAAMFALESVKSLVWLIGVSAAISLSLTWFGITWWGAAAALVGQVAGECFNLLGLALLLSRQVYLNTRVH
jgi:O-antigen/teichoic acid export membrane protein